MPGSMRRFLALATFAVAMAAHAADSPSRYLAPGFEARPAGSRLVVLPLDMELFSISAGGIEEPRADWTEAAQRNLREALAKRGARLGPDVRVLSDAEMDEFGEFLALERAVGAAIFIHHARPNLALPTKEGRLQWTLGEAVKPLKAKTGADYALFAWIRDSYASPERKAAILAMAFLGAVTFGGEQLGYASLVDLSTGRVVWFNELYRLMGDLREVPGAEETLETLLKGFPEAK
ncbi:hypothetical protein [Ramlibacter sp. PS4R-6]|uniref:hypothetical protein n=1 Tax=Ramlibacter sp. PS4R-6 TaxID=3133438 RepID=UPI00309F0EF9